MQSRSIANWLRLLLSVLLVAAASITVFVLLHFHPQCTKLSNDIGVDVAPLSGEEDAEDRGAHRRNDLLADSGLASQQKWDLSFANPKLSAQRALLIADQFRKTRFHKDEFEWWLKDIALTPLDLENSNWCWTVHFEEVWQRGVITHPNGFEIYIMMDGSVVEPEDPHGFLRNPQSIQYNPENKK